MPRRKKLVASVTELQSFQQCRRRWFLSRQYEGKTQSVHLFFGIGIHHALETYYKAIKAKANYALALGLMLDSWDAWVVEQYKGLSEVYGAMWPDAKEAYDEICNVGKRMLEVYPQYERVAEIQFTPLVIEKRVFINLGDGNYLTARIDILVRLTSSELAVVDNKTTTRGTSTGRALDLDEQGTGYAFAVWTMLETVPEFVYNVFYKNLPQEPRVIRITAKNPKGELSTDKTQNTTFDLYMQAIIRRKEDPRFYADILGVLQERGWDNFYRRESSPRNEAQVRNYGKRAKIIMEEMRRCLTNEVNAYPSPSPMKCPYCPFQAVCIAMEDGSDAEYILEKNFTKTAESPWDTPARNRREVPVEEQSA